jgi:membrane protease YdiL (CAAX protease family)
MSFAPYLVPYGLFMMFTWAGATFEARFITYPLKVVVVAAALFYYRKSYAEIRPSFHWLATPLAVVVGVLVIVPWVALDPWYPQMSLDEWKHAGQVVTGTEEAEAKDGEAREPRGWRFPHEKKRVVGFNPREAGSRGAAVAFIVVRMIGAVLLVPVFEELFIRSWVLRLMIDGDFEKVKVGVFTWGSFLGSALFWGITHHEWVAGFLCGLAFNLLLYYRKNLFDCMIAHGVANLTLALYVLRTEQWHFW